MGRAHFDNSDGLVARIWNDVTILVIQQSISNVGFNDFMMAQLGGDKIFLYFAVKTEEVMSVFNEAGIFFNTLVYDYRALSKNSEMIYERGV